MRPLPEVSEAKLNRRMNKSRTYENVVKNDATFFQRIGLDAHFVRADLCIEIGLLVGWFFGRSADFQI